MATILRLNVSDHATPGYIVATSRGQIVWRGLGKDLGQASGYDTLHTHPSTADAIRAVAARKNIQVQEQ